MFIPRKTWEQQEQERRFYEEGIAKRLFAFYANQGYEAIGNPNGTILMRKIERDTAHYVHIDKNAGASKGWVNRWSAWYNPDQPDWRLDWKQ